MFKRGDREYLKVEKEGLFGGKFRHALTVILNPFVFCSKLKI
jgi:hypothetical protein